MNWLVNTADRRHDVTNILPFLKETRTSAGPAEASRKEAQTNGNGKVVVGTADLLSLAEVVADSTIPIPQEILAVAKDVIVERHTCANL